MVQFKKELLKNGSCIKCHSEAEAKEVVAWYHANGIRWCDSKEDEAFWRHSRNNCIYYEVINGLLFWRTDCYGLTYVSYYDALLLPNDSYTCYGKSFYERIEKMIDEKLKDYQKIEPEPEPEFKVGDLVKFNVGSAPGYGIIREVVDDEYILVEYFFQKMRWFQKDNLIKIGCEE